jgi:NAD-specific glutamate dehydrogenase
MVHDTVALLRQVSYWLIQRHRRDLGIEVQVERLRPGVRELSRAYRAGSAASNARPTTLARPTCCKLACRPTLRARVASSQALHSAPDIVELAAARRCRSRRRTRLRHRRRRVRARLAAAADRGTRHRGSLARRRARQPARGPVRSHRRLAQRVLSETRERDPAAAVVQWTRGHAAEARTRAASSTTYARSRRRSTSPRSRSRCRRCGASPAEG